MIKGSLQLKILYRGVFVEDFQSENGPKIDGFGVLDRENCECQSSDPLGNQNTPKHVKRRYSQKCVLESLARKAIKTR